MQYILFVILSPMNKDRVKIKRSRAGLGLFADAPFTKGDLVIEYKGETISTEEADKRGGKYLFELNDSWTIDGSNRSNLARYINHSCRANCEPELSEDEKRVFIYAKKNIAPDEEITYNYGKDYFNQIIKKMGCRCLNCSMNS